MSRATATSDGSPFGSTRLSGIGSIQTDSGSGAGTVASAVDGKTALEKLEEVHPALVLLDVMMPGMDGWQVCRTIKRHPEFGSTRVVMVTAKGGFEDKFEGMRSGADDYVVKPVDLKELALKVERNLSAGGHSQ